MEESVDQTPVVVKQVQDNYLLEEELVMPQKVEKEHVEEEEIENMVNVKENSEAQIEVEEHNGAVNEKDADLDDLTDEFETLVEEEVKEVNVEELIEQFENLSQSIDDTSSDEDSQHENAFSMEQEETKETLSSGPERLFRQDTYTVDKKIDSSNDNPETIENVDTTDNINTIESVETANSYETTDNFDTIEIVDTSTTVESSKKFETSEHLVVTESLDSTDNADSSVDVETTNNDDTAENVDTTANVDTPEIVDIRTNVENVDICDNVDTTKNVDANKYIDTTDNVNAKDNINKVDNIETMDNVDTTDNINTDVSVDTTVNIKNTKDVSAAENVNTTDNILSNEYDVSKEKVHTTDNIETTENLNTKDNIDTNEYTNNIDTVDLNSVENDNKVDNTDDTAVNVDKIQNVCVAENVDTAENVIVIENVDSTEKMYTTENIETTENFIATDNINTNDNTISIKTTEPDSVENILKVDKSDDIGPIENEDSSDHNGRNVIVGATDNGNANNNVDLIKVNADKEVNEIENLIIADSEDKTDTTIDDNTSDNIIKCVNEDTPHNDNKIYAIDTSSVVEKDGDIEDANVVQTFDTSNEKEVINLPVNEEEIKIISSLETSNLANNETDTEEKDNELENIEIKPDTKLIVTSGMSENMELNDLKEGDIENIIDEQNSRAEVNKEGEELMHQNQTAVIENTTGEQISMDLETETNQIDEENQEHTDDNLQTVEDVIKEKSISPLDLGLPKDNVLEPIYKDAEETKDNVEDEDIQSTKSNTEDQYVTAEEVRIQKHKGISKENDIPPSIQINQEITADSGDVLPIIIPAIAIPVCSTEKDEEHKDANVGENLAKDKKCNSNEVDQLVRDIQDPELDSSLEDIAAMVDGRELVPPTEEKNRVSPEFTTAACLIDQNPDKGFDPEDPAVKGLEDWECSNLDTSVDSLATKGNKLKNVFKKKRWSRTSGSEETRSLIDQKETRVEQRNQEEEEEEKVGCFNSWLLYIFIKIFD